MSQYSYQRDPPSKYSEKELRLSLGSKVWTGSDWCRGGGGGGEAGPLNGSDDSNPDSPGNTNATVYVRPLEHDL